MNHPPIWDGVLRRLDGKMPAFAVEAWVHPLVVQHEGDALQLVCPSLFHRDRLRGRYLETISACAADAAGRPLRVELSVGKAASPSAASQGAAARDGSASGRPETLRSSAASPAPAVATLAAPRHPVPQSFDSFVVGPCNALAREAAFALAHGRQLGVSPLFLAAEPGLGKTHLARAIVLEARRAGMERVHYASAEAFTSELMAALRANRMTAFKRRFRQECDLLVLEDVQFLRSKNATQLELFHTIEHLLDAGAKVVLSADRMPKAIPELDERLRSQLASGLVAEMDSPDAEVRRRILRAKAAAGGVRLPDECLERLVDRVRGSVRDLEGVLIQLVASASLLKRPIDLELTEAALQKVAPGSARVTRLGPEAVIGVVASFFKTTPAALSSRSRRRDVVVPRQLAMYLCRRYTDASLQRIGDALGREHPAVSHAISVVERAILERAPLRYQVEALSARLDAMPAPAAGRAR
jgi:chromosomal replication initiator protein